MMQVPLVVTIGEPAGVGPDIVLLAWAQRQKLQLPDFYVLGDEAFLKDRANKLSLDLNTCDYLAEQNDAALPVRQFAKAMSCNPGEVNHANSALVIDAIGHGVNQCIAGEAAGLVTCPINKDVLYQAGFKFPGHTECLADLCEAATRRRNKPVMMLAGPSLRTVPVTIHIPLSEVCSALNTDQIVETCEIVHHDLKTRLGISNPRLAVSGLNPHAGENGAMGSEDADIIEPAIAILKKAGIDAFGPLPADTMFHSGARQNYDAAICMYHDQALIPAKTLDFDNAVNATLGLPIVRTSPDHGTAFDIAGTRKANPASFVAALKMAADMASRHRNH